MRRVLAGVLGGLMLTGCVGGQEGKMKSACKEIVLSHAVDPKAISFNDVDLSSSKMGKDEFALNYYGAEEKMTDLQRMIFERDFGEGGKGATEYIVRVNYTDRAGREGIGATREEAFCSFIDYLDSIKLSSFYVKGKRVGAKQMFDYFLFNERPKDINYHMRLE